ncbi:acyl-CoA synthetase FdrA [Zophobihabitans entericus]|uniref:Acyl-CoA synthetase FdrA n=2 Tax=Zophobihabitans entericus TaxID=1635327 RepID=A0A6G9I9N3_9GAMM|nr:acyl-CoA synthetase FdrA [Zophobihabitans entericus]QIQ20547.1 acyl-CoA synthetase FdrA [Zophobihabitans entericus]
MNKLSPQNRHTLYALTTDMDFPSPLLKRNFQGRIEQVFGKAINVLCQHTGELYSFTCSTLDNAPNCCRVSANHLDNLDIQIGDNVSTHNEYLVIGDKYLIDFSQNKLWQSQSPTFTSPDSTSYWLNIATEIESAIQTGNSLFNYADDNVFYQQLSLQLHQYRQQLVTALKENDTESVKTTIAAMIGLGVGLTPTADDYLSGMSIVLFMPAHPGNKFQTLFQQVLTENRANTTLLSAVTLNKSINNQYRESLYLLLEKIFIQFSKSISKEITTVINIGSSSGSDMLHGIMDALYLTHHLGEAMSTKIVIKKNTYFDSVSLMSISTKANQLEGVEQAFVAMATEMNKGVLRNLGLLTPELESAKNGDLMIVIKGASDAENEASLIAIEELFSNKNKGGSKHEAKYATISSAHEHIVESNLVVISVNGAFAAREARIALENDLNVMLFSDNVSIEDELALKQLASSKGLLMMGPDCGTAIINGAALCFGNAVRRGNIGIIGASGTGSQELSVRIHEFGGGISQLIGTGGRDLSEKIGGIMMLDALKMLEADDETSVIVLISKPPAPAVAQKVLLQAEKCKKPVVVCFLGQNQHYTDKPGLTFAKATKQAALKAVLLTGIKEEDLDLHPLNWPLIEEVRAKLKPEQKYIRGLFCGGTLCDESMFAALAKYPDVYSNIQPNPEYRLKDLNKSIKHTFLDFGDDDFTNGKPHPMIDPTNRISRLLQEARDPEVGVIVMDFVLGFGSHENPVGVMLDAIKESKAIAKKEGRHLEILGYVLGTDLDTPSLAQQCKLLTDAGVTWASSSTNTGLLAREFVWKGETA